MTPPCFELKGSNPIYATTSKKIRIKPSFSEKTLDGRPIYLHIYKYQSLSSLFSLFQTSCKTFPEKKENSKSFPVFYNICATRRESIYLINFSIEKIRCNSIGALFGYIHFP